MRLIEGSPFWSVMLMPFGISHTCADVFYSGHSIPITLSMMFWIDYAPTLQERAFGCALSVAAMLVIICTHFHYTLDVLYGVGLTVIIWRLYHFGLTVPAVVLNSRFYLFWEADAFPESEDDNATSESSTVSTRNVHVPPLLEDVECGTRPVSRAMPRLQMVVPGGVVPWDLSEDPRIPWARIEPIEEDQHGYKAL
mmetsp:Transcript_2527/g.2122  ORF Transcript_2527/g.2122 Transcript_2527/m.2122 type:complete len:196 (-) Transcript_2527:85-672(-)